MAEVVLSVEVEAPAGVVWDAVTDWAHQGEWMLGTTVRPTVADGRGVGGGIEAFTGAAGRLGFLDIMVVTAWDPPRRCEVRHTGRVVRGAAAFEVEALGEHRSRFVWSEWLDLPLGLLGQVGFLAVRPMMAGGVQLSLARFARWTEARAENGGQDPLTSP